MQRSDYALYIFDITYILISNFDIMFYNHRLSIILFFFTYVCYNNRTGKIKVWKKILLSNTSDQCGIFWIIESRSHFFRHFRKSVEAWNPVESRKHGIWLRNWKPSPSNLGRPNLRIRNGRETAFPNLSKVYKIMFLYSILIMFVLNDHWTVFLHPPTIGRKLEYAALFFFRR